MNCPALILEIQKPNLWVPNTKFPECAKSISHSVIRNIKILIWATRIENNRLFKQPFPSIICHVLLGKGFNLWIVINLCFKQRFEFYKIKGIKKKHILKWQLKRGFSYRIKETILRTIYSSSIIQTLKKIRFWSTSLSL